MRPSLRPDPITTGWAVVTSAGVVRLGLGFVASLLIARALGPADYGIYAVLAATVGIVGSLAEGGLTEAAVLRISRVASSGGDTAMVESRASRRMNIWMSWRRPANASLAKWYISSYISMRCTMNGTILGFSLI